MSEIKKEKPTKEKLDSLNIDNWSPWECEPSTFNYEYFAQEVAYILEGKVIVKTPKGQVEINKGDLVRFPKGLKCTWNVKNKIKKMYTFE